MVMTAQRFPLALPGRIRVEGWVGLDQVGWLPGAAAFNDDAVTIVVPRLRSFLRWTSAVIWRSSPSASLVSFLFEFRVCGTPIFDAFLTIRT
jgi:hypothetical protein